MTCLRCGETKRKRAVHTFRRTIEGCSFVADAEVDACARCRDAQVPVALLLEFERAVAMDIARRGPVSGDTFRFMRKAIPLQPIEVSRVLCVSLETVNRWEAGRRAIDRGSWLVVATLLLETFDAPTPLLPRIEALREPLQAERVLSLGQEPRRTLRDVLELLGGPVVLTDTDIAEALGVSVIAVRARLAELAVAGIVERTEAQPSGGFRWELRADGVGALDRIARDRGLDVDAALPSADPAPAQGPISARVERVVPMAWRATS